MTDGMDQKSVADEAQFRTSVLVKLAEIGRDVTHVKGTCDETKKALADHMEDDDERFGTVNQKIGDNSSSIAKGAGIFAALVVMVGIIMWILDKARP